jgi:trimeric autotransporter adhesin
MRLRTLSVPLLLNLFCLIPMALGQTATTTTLAITSGGTAVAMVPAGSPVTLTATVTANGTPVRPGQVNFCDATAPHCTDIHILATAQLTAAGIATMKFFPGIGSHSYRAVFLGTTSKAVSSSTVSPLAVPGTFTTTTTISSIGNPGNYSLTATVIGSGGSTPPAGTVSFLDTSNTNYVLQTAPLVPGMPGVSFVNSSASATNPFPQSVGVADFNKDGKLDLALPVYSMFGPLSAISVLLGNGDGTFSSAPTVPLLSLNAGSVAVADFNGDGNADMVVTLPDVRGNISGTLNEIQVMMGNGDGTFTLGQNLLIADPFFVTTGDFNGDGIPDLAVATPANSTVSILLGNGDGTFTFKATATAGVDPISIAVGDFNADGKSDLAVANFGNDRVTILLGNGDGTFTATPGNAPAVGGSPESVTVADFNGDGIADVAVANSFVNSGHAGTVTILLGNGDGTFVPAASPSTDINSYAIAAADFNGDGKADLVVGNAINAGTVSVLVGNGDGTFAPTINQPAGNDPLFVATGDFNGDGLADIAAADNDISEAYVLLSALGAETATATVTGISLVGTGTHQVDASYPGDSTYGPSVSSTVGLTAERVPTTLTLSSNPTSINFGQQVALTATLTPDTAQNNNASGTVTFTNGSTVLGTGTITNGVATLNTTSLSASTTALTAAYPGDTNFLGTTSNTIGVLVAPNDFLITLASPSLTIQSQHNLTTTVTLTSVNGFADSLALTCANLPAYVTCQFTPATATLGANGTTTAALVISIAALPTHARDHTPLHPGSPTTLPIGLALLLSPASLFTGFATLPIRRKSIRRLHLLLLAAIPFTLALSGCGTLIFPQALTSAGTGTYTIPIAATGASTGSTHTTQLTLTITQ